MKLNQAESAAHEEEGTDRKILQVSDDDIHKATERIKLLNRIAPFQLPLFMQTTPEERMSVSYPPFFP